MTSNMSKYNDIKYVQIQWHQTCQNTMTSNMSKYKWNQTYPFPNTMTSNMSEYNVTRHVQRKETCQNTITLDMSKYNDIKHVKYNATRHVQTQGNMSKYNKTRHVQIQWHQTCQNTKWSPWSLIGWNILDPLWNRWSEFKETWQNARSQRPLPSSCLFIGLISKQKWSPWPIRKKGGTLYSGAYEMWTFWDSCYF